MSFRTAALPCLGSLLIWSAGQAADKKAAHVERVGDISRKNIVMAQSLATADTCFVSDNQPLSYYISGWVSGSELYKSLMNPGNQCTDPYPFTVMQVNMPMGFDKGTSFKISVDIEAVDSTTVPGCWVPGVLLALSSEYTITIPEAGNYNLWIPLDTPTAVNGPFFAGVYLGNNVDTSAHPMLFTDAAPVACATFNIWSDSVGWIDLTDNSFFDFPGRLAMEVFGTPGGGPAITPILQIVSPLAGDVLYGSAELWAWDRALTGAVDFVVFEYSNGGAFTEIGRDFDGTSPNRNGVDAAISGTGYNVTWDFSALPEGTYTLRATQVPTAGDATSSSISVYLEPTPPVARITSPSAGSAFCPPLDIYMNSYDENLAAVEVQRREAASFVSVDVTAVNQFAVGDADGEPLDGNHAYNGEFGDYYSGPVAAAMAALVWSNRGYPALATQGTTSLTALQVAEAIATSLGTRSRQGTYDEAMLTGLRSYAASKGGGFEFGHKRNPYYSDVRIAVEDESRVVLLGLSGTPGLWLTVDGLVSWLRGDSTYLVTVANPMTGTIQNAYWRNRTGYSELSLAGVWHRVEIMVSMFASAYPVSRVNVGADLSGIDGWSVHWGTTGIGDGTYFYLRSKAEDIDNHTGSHTILAKLDCAAAYMHGDYNSDRTTTIADLVLLRDFVVGVGDAPVGGPGRADCNCDNVVNIADVIYYMNYLLGVASTPCR